MDYDLLVRGGRVVDGSGLPGYQADIGVRDGKIAAIGRLGGTAARRIDADGLVVAPGFIDHHTHLDAQMLWDPYGTSEPQHGVTTVVLGNCGLTLAPVAPGGEEVLLQSFVRVEAMPRAALEQGIPWGWRGYGDYLAALDGRVGVNVGGLVGHVALRHPDGYRIDRALIELARVVPDFRAPDTIRLAPIAAYSRYSEVWDAIDRLRGLVERGEHLALPMERARVT